MLARPSGFDRSQLCSDEGPPIGAVAAEPWGGVAFEIAVWVLRLGHERAEQRIAARLCVHA
jgi:hypothetical protein